MGGATSGFVALLMLTKELPTIHLDRTAPKLPWYGRFAINLITSFPANIVFGIFIGFIIVNLSTRKLLIALFLLAVTGWQFLFSFPHFESRPEQQADSCQEI